MAIRLPDIDFGPHDAVRTGYDIKRTLRTIDTTSPRTIILYRLTLSLMPAAITGYVIYDEYKFNNYEIVGVSTYIMLIALASVVINILNIHSIHPWYKTL